MVRRIDIPKKHYSKNYVKGQHSVVYWNKHTRKIISFDFTKLVIRRNDHFYYIGQNHMLISPTRLTKLITDYRLSSIPLSILDERREIGTNLMLNIKEMFDKKIYETKELMINQRDRKYLDAIMDFLIQYEIRILAVEKFITNGTFCGFIDMIVEFNGVACIFEIKCRNEPVIRDTDLIQTGVYKKMLGIPTFMVFVDDNGVVDCIRVNGKKAKGETQPDYLKKMLNFLVQWNVIKEPKINRIVCD